MYEYFKKQRKKLFNYFLESESKLGLLFCYYVLRYSVSVEDFKKSKLSRYNLLAWLSPKIKKTFVRTEEIQPEVRENSKEESEEREKIDSLMRDKFISITRESKRIVYNAARDPNKTDTLRINYDVLGNIFEFSSLEEQFALAKTSIMSWSNYCDLARDENNPAYSVRRALNNATSPGEKQAILDQIDRIKESHPPIFLAQMGGYNCIYNIPVIDIGEQMGSTGYLDFHMDITEPVRGFDKYFRPFYACLVEFGGHRNVFKIFQIHTERKEWECAGNSGASDCGSNVLDSIKEGLNKDSVISKGDIDRERLGRRGLAFFARTFNKTPAALPVLVKEGAERWSYEPNPSDPKYSEITYPSTL